MSMFRQHGTGIRKSHFKNIKTTTPERSVISATLRFRTRYDSALAPPFRIQTKMIIVICYRLARHSPCRARVSATACCRNVSSGRTPTSSPFHSFTDDCENATHQTHPRRWRRSLDNSAGPAVASHTTTTKNTACALQRSHVSLDHVVGHSDRARFAA